MRHVFTVLFSFASVLVMAQASIIFNGAGITMGAPDPTLVNDNIYIVIDNPRSDAIKFVNDDVFNAGGIVSENENHVVRWMTGDNPPVGAGYPNARWFVPFLSGTGGNIDIVGTELWTYTGGTAGGYIDFSSYATPASNNLPLPSDVTHLNNYISQVDNSANVVNRFWIIDAASHTTKPDVEIRLRYDQDELDGIAENDLLIQRFNPNTSFWMDFVDFSVAGNATNNVFGPWLIPGAEFHRSWTLSKSSDPLPIELIYFDAVCAEQGRVLLTWASASEQDNKEFIIERSEDGIVWEQFDVIAGAGNSSAELRYQTYDNNPFSGITYYRLTQVDFDGAIEIFEPTASDCEGVGFELVSAYEQNGRVILDVSSGMEDDFDISIYDMQGKVVLSSTNRPVYMGRTLINLDKGSLASGVYTIRLQSENNMATRKVFLD